MENGSWGEKSKFCLKMYNYMLIAIGLKGLRSLKVRKATRMGICTSVNVAKS